MTQIADEQLELQLYRQIFIKVNWYATVNCNNLYISFFIIYLYIVNDLYEDERFYECTRVVKFFHLPS